MDMHSLGCGLEATAALVQNGEVGGKELLVACSGSPVCWGPHYSQSTPFAIVFLIKEYKYLSSMLDFSSTLNLHCDFLESV